ncbi:hypothetical protein ON010_g14329 [Phytophthora cinnamomi]|nr:hypothetical protein ON010_g14329 [Phytophthora cinnamomi]
MLLTNCLSNNIEWLVAKHDLAPPKSPLRLESRWRCVSSPLRAGPSTDERVFVKALTQGLAGQGALTSLARAPSLHLADAGRDVQRRQRAVQSARFEPRRLTGQRRARAADQRVAGSNPVVNALSESSLRAMERHCRDPLDWWPASGASAAAVNGRGFRAPTGRAQWGARIAETVRPAALNSGYGRADYDGQPKAA